MAAAGSTKASWSFSSTEAPETFNRAMLDFLLRQRAPSPLRGRLVLAGWVPWLGSMHG
jgi:hypothetical protein